jgi:metal-sulfur cluster biosynthetic enzyme
MASLDLNDEQIRETLKRVNDPELMINIVDLGLVYEVNVDNQGGNVFVLMTLTTPFCPVGPYVKQEIARCIKEDYPDVDKVEVQFTFNPPWDKDMISEEAKMELGIF